MPDEYSNSRLGEVSYMGWEMGNRRKCGLGSLPHEQLLT